MKTKETIKSKVFLCDFRDIRAPETWSKDFVESALFDVNQPMQAPPPNPVNIGPSAYQYFYSVSDTQLSLRGSVCDWAHSDLNIAEIPHWNGKMKNPRKYPDTTVSFGETWPVIIAETLRYLGLTTQATAREYSRERDVPIGKIHERLREKILELPNGQTADKLIFLNADRGRGGVKREFHQVKESLELMSGSNNSMRYIPDGSRRLWRELWDEGWDGLPSFFSTSILLPKTLAPVNDNGTITGSPPLPHELVLSPMSTIFHEMGHLAVKLPDLYASEFGPWGVFDLMGGPAVSTHYPMPFGSYSRYLAGWLDFTRLKRQNHQLELQPLESHNRACRVPNGAPGLDHYLVLENRAELHYTNASPRIPPENRGRALLLYRLDEHRRMGIPGTTDGNRKCTSVVRLKQRYGEAWKAEDSIGVLPPANEIHNYPATCRNERGELWWSVDEINSLSYYGLGVRLKFKALNLVEDYHHAAWFGMSENRWNSLEPDIFGGSIGHVMMQDSTIIVDNKKYNHALYLHPGWSSRGMGQIKGVYNLRETVNLDMPHRLYATLGMPDNTWRSDGVKVIFQRGDVSCTFNMSPGTVLKICHDFPAGSNAFSITVDIRNTSLNDKAYILDGWLVPLAPVVYDFIEQANEAAWRTGAGPIRYGNGSSGGEARLHYRRRFEDNVFHGLDILSTKPDDTHDGWIEWIYQNVPIPRGGAFLRGAAGWFKGEGRNKRMKITVTIINAGNEVALMENLTVPEVSGNETGRIVDRDLTLLELPIPGSYAGSTTDIKIRVENANSDEVGKLAWPYLYLTTG
ncbi:MAG: hypothetical protein GY765_18575 [bacterium]|nr:hypothetical protein [bacterium]